MKKTFRILSVMALAGLVVFGSCKKNENENNNSTNENGTLSAGIVQPNNGAKTSITINGNQGIIKWTEGDQIVVGDGSQSGTFTLLEGAGESTAVFRCPEFPVDELDFYTAAYPASAATVSGTAVTFNIPAEQTLTRIEDGFGNGANPMVAYATAPLDHLEFKSVFGGVGIKLQAPVPASITKLVLTDNNNYLCGQFSVADVTVDEPSATYVSGGGHSITLNLPAGGLRVDSEGCNVYIMLPVGALSNGFTLDAYAGETRVTNKDTDSSAATITLNNINNAVTYNVVLPAGQANTAEAVMALANDPGYTGPIEIVSGTLDFAGLTSAEQPLTQQIVVAAGSHVELNNLYSSKIGDIGMVIDNGAEVELNNVNVSSTKRALNVEANAVVNINGGSLTATGNEAYIRGLNVIGNNAKVNISGCEITSPYYAINVTNYQNVEINLTNNTVAGGWAALNIWGQHNTVHAENCTFESINDKPYNAQGWNNFGTIVFNDDYQTIELDHCIVKSQSYSANKQYGIIFNREYSSPYRIADNCTFSMTNNSSFIGVTTSTEYMINNNGEGNTWNFDATTTINWDSSEGHPVE